MPSPRKKPKPVRKRRKRLSVLVPEDLLRSLDIELSKMRMQPGKAPNRAGLVLELISVGMTRLGWPDRARPGDPESAHESLLRAAKEMKERGKDLKRSGAAREAGQAFLMAAARELEALAVLRGTDEEAMRTALIEAVLLIKLGTGYKHLPSVPSSEELAASVQ